MGYQTDCRFFSGYKPCSLHTDCSENCPVKEKASPRILVVHLEALGAVLRGTVVLPAIKRHWPSSHITWITSPMAAPLLENNPSIDHVLKNDHNGVLSLSTLAFDYAFCIDKSLTAGGLLRVPLKIREKRGFSVNAETGAVVPLNEEAQYLYSLGLSNDEKFFVNKKTEGQLIVESLGLDYKSDNYVFEFSNDEKLLFLKDKKDFGLENFKGPIIGLNTGCSPTIPYKKFSVHGWLELIDHLHQTFPHGRLVLLGGPEDTARNKEIATMRPSLLSTPTDRGLRAGFRYVSLCDVVVTGDSLGMHMAIALKKWVIAWFGPTCAHEIEFYNRGQAVLTAASCSPCWKRFCDQAQMCYDMVSWREITDAIARGLRTLESNEKVFAPTAKNLPEIPV